MVPGAGEGCALCVLVGWKCVYSCKAEGTTAVTALLRSLPEGHMRQVLVVTCVHSYAPGMRVGALCAPGRKCTQGGCLVAAQGRGRAASCFSCK